MEVAGRRSTEAERSTRSERVVDSETPLGARHPSAADVVTASTVGVPALSAAMVSPGTVAGAATMRWIDGADADGLGVGADEVDALAAAIVEDDSATERAAEVTDDVVVAAGALEGCAEVCDVVFVGGAVTAAAGAPAGAVVAATLGAGATAGAGLRRTSLVGCVSVVRTTDWADRVAGADAAEGEGADAGVAAAIPVLGAIAAERVRSAGEKACGVPTIRRNGATRAAVAVAEAGGAARAVAEDAMLGNPASSTRRIVGAVVAALGITSPPERSPATIDVNRVLIGVGRHDGAGG
jgi:hypothetical protein